MNRKVLAQLVKSMYKKSRLNIILNGEGVNAIL